MQTKVSSTQKINFVADRIGNTIYTALGSSSDHMAWPMPIVKNGRALRYYSYPLWAEKFLEATNTLEEKGLSTLEIAKICKYPSILARIPFILEIKDFSQLTIKQLEEIALKVYDYCDVLQEELFCGTKGINILKNESFNFDTFPISSKTIKNSSIARISGILFSYTELLYTYFHNFGHEFQGPFTHNKNVNIIIKDFHDLKPEFWNCEDFPAKNIRMELAYPSNIEVNIDLHNRMSESKSVNSELLGYRFYADDVLLSDKEIDSLLTKITTFYTEFISSIPMNADFLSKKCVEATLYSLKPLCDAAGINWKQKVVLPVVVSKEIEEWISFISSMPVNKELQQMRFNPFVTQKQMKETIKKSK